MNITELLSNPSMIHAAIVHMPIAAAVIGLILVILSAIFHRNNTVRAVTALVFLVLVSTAYLAIESGEDARELVPNTLPNAVWENISAHAASAEKVLYAGAFTLACLVISLIRIDMIRIFALLLAAVGAIATNIFCANTGHLGGVLVYNHGVGTPLVHQAPPAVPPVPVEAPPAAMSADGAAPVVPVESAPVPVVAEDPEVLPIRDFTPEEAAQVSFKRDVWPIIDDHCTKCHENPDADGEYDMMTVENMTKGGKKGGPGIVPGKPDESAIIQYIRGIAKPRMPDEKPPLADADLHTLRMWIAAGAKDDSQEAEAVPAPVEPVVETSAPAEPVPAPAVEVPAVTVEPVVEAPAPAEDPSTVAPAVEAAPVVEAPPVAPVEDAVPVTEPAAPVEAAPTA